MFTRWLDISPGLSCLLLGPRRAGKTTLLKQQFPDLKYTSLDDLDYLDWANKDPKGFVQELGNSGIIDEIQRVPRLTIAVKHAIDTYNAFILMTGSSSLGLLDASAETMAGRINIQSLPTACWGEDLGPPTHSVFDEKASYLQIKEGNRLLHRAMTYGQFPEVLIQDKESDKQQILTRYKNTYFSRDLMQLSNIENMEGLLAIFHHLANSLGSHLEVSNFAREAGVSHFTAKKYLNSLAGGRTYFQFARLPVRTGKKILKG